MQESSFEAPDLLALYIDSMRRYDLLSMEEEVALAAACGAAAAAVQRLNLPHTPDERTALDDTIQQGRLARQTLINANLALVISIALKVQGRGVDLLDLIQEGNIALMRAVDRYDPAHGHRLSTFATPTIRRAMNRALATQSRTMRLSTRLHNQLLQMHQVRNNLFEQLGREPAVAELARAIGQSRRKTEALLQLSRPILSLNSAAETELYEEWADLLPDEPGLDEADVFHPQRLWDALDSLSTREHRIITQHFGLTNQTPRQQKALAAEMGVSRERVRKLKDRALGTLRGLLDEMDEAPAKERGEPPQE